MKRYRIHVVILALSMLVGCGSASKDIEVDVPEDVVEEEVVEVVTGVENPLTGLLMDEKWENQRPVAVMLNNLKGSLPQQGNGQADVIYEVLAEGGITRMVALYQEIDLIDTVGSIRSARPYYIELAMGHDAIFIHAGGSQDAYSSIRKWGTTALDGVNGPYLNNKGAESNLMWRDTDRMSKMSYEHTVVSNGNAMMEFIPESAWRDIGEAYASPFIFVDDVSLDGENATVVTVPFSTYKTGAFEYDGESGLYVVSQYGNVTVDGNTQESLTAQNVLILKARCVDTYDDLDHIDVYVTGSGSGYYATDSQIIPINWSKSAYNEPMVYTTEDGALLELQRGTTYINIVPLNAKVTWE